MPLALIGIATLDYFSLLATAPATPALLYLIDIATHDSLQTASSLLIGHIIANAANR
jgi:hypothetical protein